MHEEKNAAARLQNQPPRQPHCLTLEDRRCLRATGVSKVDSFDEQTVVANTSLGQLVVQGEALHIEKLNVESGELTITGRVASLQYTGGEERRKGTLSRLFR